MYIAINIAVKFSKLRSYFTSNSPKEDNFNSIIVVDHRLHHIAKTIYMLIRCSVADFIYLVITGTDRSITKSLHYCGHTGIYKQCVSE